jgi:ArsR family transcriptional regulator
MNRAMELVRIYECLCDRTRLRVLNVLAQGPLCVCHFQEVLAEPQVKISKHLAYLRERGMVECELKANLACLQDCARENPVFQKDLARLKKFAPRFNATSPCGCAPAVK